MVNNARFLILPWVQVRNLASTVLAHSSRRLRPTPTFQYRNQWMFFFLHLIPSIVYFIKSYNGNVTWIIEIYSHRTHYRLLIHLRANHR